MSGPDKGHFTVTPELQGAALSCFAAYAAFALGPRLESVIEETGEADKRFPPIIQAVLSDVLRQVEEIARDEAAREE